MFGPEELHHKQVAELDIRKLLDIARSGAEGADQDRDLEHVGQSGRDSKESGR